MKKLTTTFIVFIMLIIGIGIFEYEYIKSNRTEEFEKYYVDLNEISQLYQNGHNEVATEKFVLLKQTMSEANEEDGKVITYMILSLLLFLVIIFLYTYLRIIRPFDRMKNFAGQISAGNFDEELKYTRGDFFGDFTWAFDNMRREIIKARKGEKEAIENNKTVIASLSHDIKTPVASLRAYSEGLEANMDTTPEKRKKYLEVIMRKCDDISRLTNDLTIHSLTGLDRLMVQCRPTDLNETVKKTISDLAPDRDKINLMLPDRSIIIYADSNRIAQIIENLLNNSEKYAGTDIDVSVSVNENSCDEAILEIRDYGTGIPNEDMPFIFDKFFRGHNKCDKPGSGLGLFIVKYLVEKQGGRIETVNVNPGFSVKIFFDTVKKE